MASSTSTKPHVDFYSVLHHYWQQVHPDALWVPQTQHVLKQIHLLSVVRPFTRTLNVPDLYLFQHYFLKLKASSTILSCVLFLLRYLPPTLHPNHLTLSSEVFLDESSPPHLLFHNHIISHFTFSIVSWLRPLLTPFVLPSFCNQNSISKWQICSYHCHP